MNSEYMSKAQDYAANAQQDYEQTLSYLLSGLEDTKALDAEAANIRYQNLVNQIKQQIPDIQDTFDTNTKAAYINKEQGLQQINADLSRLGVNTQGYGVTQRLINQNAYGTAYGSIVKDYNKDLRDVANQQINATGELNAELADLDSDYAKKKLEAQQYIKEKGEEKYNDAYNKSYSDMQYADSLEQQELENKRYEQEYADKMKQQAWQNAFTEKQYKDKLQQQAFENDLANRQLALQQRQMAASAAASAAASRAAAQAQTAKKTDDRIVNTNYCLYLGRGKAQDEYNILLNQIYKDGGIKTGTLRKYLDTAKANGIFTNDQISKIKKQFGI